MTWNALHRIRYFACAISVAFFYLSQSAHAEGFEQLTEINHELNINKWYLSVQGGGQFLDVGRSAWVNNGILATAPYQQDRYINTNPSSPHTLLGVEWGARWKVDSSWMSGLSISGQYQYFFNTNIDGVIQQFSDSEFTNYAYQMDSSTNLIVANGKIHLNAIKGIMPYLNAGIGGAITETKFYHEVAFTGITPRLSPDFNALSASQFGYIFGAGLEYALSEQFSLIAGYQFSGLGHLKTGYGQGTWSAESLNFGSLYANAFLVSFNYFWLSEQEKD